MKRNFSCSDSLTHFLSHPLEGEIKAEEDCIFNGEFQSMVDGSGGGDGEDYGGEETGQFGDKKRRLSNHQVKSLEKIFEVDNKLDPERKVKVAQDLGLQPRQVAIWFQNRRARWKTKQLERDYNLLKSSYDALKHNYHKLEKEKEIIIKENHATPPRRRGRPSGTGGTPPVFDPVAMEAMIAERVASALVAYELANPRNGNGGGGGAGNPGGNGGNPRPCSYKDFMNCKPHDFAGTGGVIELTRWFEKTESVFQISNCTADCQVKFAACTFMRAALSWWNTHVQTIGIVEANALTWGELKTMMIEEYCPRSELQKLEHELWNLTMQGSDITGYTNRFNDLSVLCPGMVTPVAKKIERYIWGLAAQIQNSVTAFNPLTYESVKSVAIRMTDHAVRQGMMVPKAEPSREQHKRKPWDSNNNSNNSNNNNNNRQISAQAPPKRQHTISAYAAIPVNAVAPQRQYGGSLPMCNKCNFHHTGACRELVCTNCKNKGHTARYCKGTPVGPAPNNNTGSSRACYGCGDTGHFKRDCPKAAGTATGRVFALGAKEDRKQKGPAE